MPRCDRSGHRHSIGDEDRSLSPTGQRWRHLEAVHLDGVNLGPGLRSNDSVDDQSAVALKVLDRRLGVAAELAVHTTGVPAAQREALLGPADRVSFRAPLE